MASVNKIHVDIRTRTVIIKKNTHNFYFSLNKKSYVNFIFEKITYRVIFDKMSQNNFETIRELFKEVWDFKVISTSYDF